MDKQVEDGLKEKAYEPATEENKVSVIFKVLAWCDFVVGFVVGIVSGQRGYSFLWSVALIYWVSSFVCGMVFLGFAEIIQLLHDIKRKI